MTAPDTRTLRVLDQTGDTAITWDVRDEETKLAAHTHFAALKGKGYLAYTVDANGIPDSVIQEFDESAPEIVMSPQLVGG